MTAWAARFGLSVTGAGPGADARSGATVLAARTAAGTPVFLKVTAGGSPLAAAARRELRVYTELAPAYAPRLLDAADEPDVVLVLAAAGSARAAADWADRDWAAL